MKFNRRDFLKGSTVLSAGTAVDLSFNEMASLWPRRQISSFPIMQGVTTETSTQIVVSAPASLKLNFVLVDSETDETFDANILKTSTRNFSQEAVYKMYFVGLKLGRTYFFRVISNSNRVLDERELKTLDTKKTQARVALLSCMNDMVGTNINEMWAAVEKSAPDFICLLGDNVYGDLLLLHGPKMLWNRYLETRTNLPFYHWRKLVPAIAIWDDHDFGKNDVMGDYAHRENSLNIFNSMYAQHPVKDFYERGPGVSSSCEMFGHRFLFLDGRYFRQTAGANPTFLGDEQVKWVAEQAAKAKGPLFLCLGSQFFGLHQSRNNSYESLRGEEFEQFKKAIASTNQPVLMASGDVHYSEVQQIQNSYAGFDGFEITSSCMHSLVNTKMDENNRRLTGTLQNNFVFLNIDQAGSYQATCLGVRNERFSVQLHF